MNMRGFKVKSKQAFLALMGMVLLSVVFFLYDKYILSKDANEVKAPSIKVQIDGPQKNPEKYYLTLNDVEKATKAKVEGNIPQLKRRSNIEGNENEYLAYYHYKKDGKDVVLFKTENGTQKYEFSQSTFAVKLSEIEDNKPSYTEKAVAEPIFQYKDAENWKNYQVKTPVIVETKSEENHLTLWQKTQDMEVEWVFGIENQSVIKNTFKLANTENTNRMIWKIDLSDKANKYITTNNKDVINNGKKRNNFLKFGDVEVDWNDFQDGETRAETSTVDQSVSIYFYETGKIGALYIDPTFTTTVTTSPNQVQVDDGTRMWCFGRGAASSANQFWQPARFYHDTAGGNPTSCTSGGDNLLPATDATYDGLFDYNGAYADSSSNSVFLLETTPTRAVVQTFRNAARDSTGKFTVYPNGVGYLHFNLGDVTASDTDATWTVHDDSASPQAFNYDSSNIAWYISDTSNNNYAGVSLVPFTPFSAPNFNTQDIPGTIGDNNGWYVVSSELGGVFDDINQTMALDWSNYRATTTTRDNKRLDYRTPDSLIDGLANAVIWDHAGETGYFWTGLEGADSDLCGGGDGFDTGSCNSGDTAVGNGTTAYTGTYAATFDGDSTGTDVAYAQETITTAPISSIRFALNIATETLGNSQQMTVASFLNGGTTISTLQVRQDGSGNLILCITVGSQTCGTTVLSTGTWYQVEMFAGQVTNIDGNASGNDIHHTEVYLNGVSEASRTSDTTDSEIATARVGLISSDVGNNTIHIDNIAINQGATGTVNFDPTEGTYALQHTNWGSDLSFDLDRAGYQAAGPSVLVRNWKSLNEPSQITLENKKLVNETDYNADVLPFSESWINDSDGTCGTGGWARLAEAGDDSDSDEYLNDTTNDFDFSSTSSCNWTDSSTDGIYFGRKDRFSGVNTVLATLGVGSPTVTWEYCSANTDLATTCDTWTSLSVTDTTSGASTFKASGNFNFTPPSQWIRSTEGDTCSTVNNCREALFYIRGRVTAGSYSTAPVESQIKSDILAMQYQGTITTNDQTFTLKSRSTVGEWKIDEGTGTTVNDSTGLSNSLTLSGATWRKNNKESNRETYLEFDGSNDYITRAADPDLNFGAESFSVTGWFRHPLAVSGTDTLISRASGVNGVGWKVYMNSSGNVCFGIDDTAGSFPEDSACTTTTYTDSSWHHVAAVKTSQTSITIYVDGKNEISDSTLGSNETLDASQALYIGIDADGTSNPWAGDLDNVTIFSYALSTDQIYADIPDPTGALLGSNATNPLQNGLVGHWMLDENTGTNASDSSGNAFAGTLTNSPTWGGGMFGSGAVFGNSTNFISIGDQSALELQTFTYSAWVYRTGTCGSFNVCAIYSKGGSNSSGFRFELNAFGSRPYAAQLILNDTQEVRSTTEIATNRWYHLAASADGSKVRIYVNGVLETEAVQTQTPAYGTEAVKIGNGNTANDLPFTGTVDDVRAYNRVLSPSEVAALYSYAPAPVGYWKFDENTGTSANDSSSNTNTGTLTNSPTWVSGKYGSGLSFAGSNAHVIRADDADFDFGAGQSFSYSAWIKHNTASAQEVILSKYAGAIGEGGYKMIMESDGDLTCAIDFDNTWTPSDSVTSTAANYDDNNWHYVSCIKTADASLILYIDGVPIASDTSISASTTLANSDPLYIGIDADGTSNDWVGQLDEVKIYNYARTASQIVQDMNGEHPLVGTPVAGAVAHWKMDDLTGTTAQDTTPNNNDLTLSSASWTTSGKYYGAWNGTGGAIRLSRTTDPDLEFGATEDIGISLWFKSDSANNPAAAEYLVASGGPAGSAGYAIYADTNGFICFGIDDDSSWGPDVASCSTQDFYDNTWHHIVGTRNVATDTTSIYIDGKLADSDTDTTSATLDSSPTFYIGDIDADDAGSGEEFAGDIDEVKIYRAALSSSNVLIEFNQGKTAAFGSLSTTSDGITSSNGADRSYCVPGDASSCSSPLAVWGFDENTGTSSTSDISGNGNTGTLTNIDSTDWSSGKFGSSIRINTDGSVDEIISIANESNFDFGTGSFSLSGWFKHGDNSSGLNEYIVSKRCNGTSCATGAGFAVYFPTLSNNLCFAIDDDVNEDSICSGSYGDNAWHHYVAVKNGTSAIYLYVDGVLIGSDTSLTTSGSLNNNSNLTFGATTVSGLGSSFYYNGYVDQTAVFNSVLSQAQISWLYNKGAPIAHYKFDECTGTTVYDSARTSNNAATGNNGSWSGTSGTNTSAGTCTIANSATAWYNGATGKLNRALDFDGTDDQIDAGSASIVDNLVQKTVTSWIYLDGYGEGGYGRIIDKGTGASPANGWGLMSCGSSGVCNTNSLSYFQSWDNDVNPGWWSTPANSLPTGQWVHVAVSYDRSSSSNDPVFYIDGKPATVSENDTPSGTVDNDDSHNLFIGNRDGGTRTLDGRIDDVRIYNYILNSAQIKTVYSDGAAVRFGPQTGSP